MAEWNAAQYLKFKAERTQPALDLARRLSLLSPDTVLDIGCGPGNSTAVLKDLFPNADITGIDKSEAMLQEARASYPELTFLQCDASDSLQSLKKTFDIVFSNACIQWIPSHEKLIPAMMQLLNSKGVLAVQAPINRNEPLHRVIDEVAAMPRWGFSQKSLEPNRMLSSEEYFDILSRCTDTFDIWETTYFHRMPSHEALLEWVKGTRLRPYLDALSETDSIAFQNAILQKAQILYPKCENGEILFRFKRLFFTAVRN